VSDDVPEEQVISQDPDPGEKVDADATVTLVVSSGRGEAAVPQVAGAAQDAAEQALEAAGFQVSVQRAYSDTVPSGQVISSNPAAGRQITRGRTVTLTVSRGAQGLAVPQVVGLQADEARETLEQAGLGVKVTEQETTQPAGTVMKQDPPTGTRVERGATVTLTVARARPEVPDVSTDNPSEEQARATLEDAGFAVRVVSREDPDAALAGRVVDQSPDQGEPRSSGATVTIYVAAAPAATATPTPTPTPTATTTTPGG
jgi:eukaryotic-like serine/threonine-protein kinase